jgi:hypothetical protein
MAYEFRDDKQSDETIPMQFEVLPLDAKNLEALERLMAWGSKKPIPTNSLEDIPF